ncbi:hypothetical protein MRX96_032115 [Rhipicephalus microplus]
MQSIQYPLGYLPDKNQFFDDGECKGPEYHWISVYLVSSLIVGLGLSLCLFVFVSTSSNLLKDVITTRIREKLDYSVDPCEDFYKFVCNTFRGHNEFSQAQDSVRLFTLMRLIVPLIPESNQNSWQKAAGMYHACLNFVSSYEPETQYLANWMRSQNLDFLNQTKLATVNPVDMMVRGSIDLGVKVLISIIFSKRHFLNKKRVIQLDFSKEQKKWGDEEHSLQNYVKLFMLFGASPPHDQELASRMKEYEETLSAILKNTLDFNKTMDFIRINELGKQTAPYVTSGEWGNIISKYTNSTYTASDYINYRPHATNILVKLFQNVLVGEKGLRYLVAWNIYRQLVKFTEPYMFLQGRSASDACYEHVKKVMNLAVLSPYLQSEVQVHMIEKAKRMVSEIRSTFLKTLQYSSWLSINFRVAAIRKLGSMKSYVGSPGRRLDPEFVEAIYKPYPDAPLDLLFPTWIKALALSTHYIWTDQTTPLYDEARYSPYYTHYFNDFTVATANMLRSFMYPDGPIALNYGGLGTMIGHEIMHAFGVKGIQELEGYEPQNNDYVIKEYTKRALCLRKSHKSVLSLTAEQEVLNTTLDDENLSDLVGSKVAYEAFNSLIPEHRDEVLVGLDFTAEQLFFFNNCAKLCAQNAIPGKRYAPYRSRCIVPLMNMPEFSHAFRCAVGTPMNPQDKCTFW